MAKGKRIRKEHAMEASQPAPSAPPASTVHSEEAKALLEGLVDTEHQAHCSLVTSHAGTLMVLGISYADAVKRVNEYTDEGQLNTLLEWETFIWTGERFAEMWLHHKSIRVGWVIEVVELTDEQWKAYVTDHIMRQNQAAINRAQQSGLMQ